MKNQNKNYGFTLVICTSLFVGEVCFAKRLTSSQVDLLNILLESTPVVTARIKVAYDKANQVVKTLDAHGKNHAVDQHNHAAGSIKNHANHMIHNENIGVDLHSHPVASGKNHPVHANHNEQDFVKAQLALILDPVKKFFDVVREYQAVIRPLLDESIALHSSEPQESFGMGLLKAHFSKYFESKVDVVALFEQEVKNKEDLRAVCSAFIILFNDLNDSLSDRAKQEYEKLVQAIQSKENQKKKNQAIQAMGATAAAAA
jgi:hypothetical protein